MIPRTVVVSNTYFAGSIAILERWLLTCEGGEKAYGVVYIGAETDG